KGPPWRDQRTAGPYYKGNEQGNTCAKQPVPAPLSPDRVKCREVRLSTKWRSRSCAPVRRSRSSGGSSRLTQVAATRLMSDRSRSPFRRAVGERLAAWAASQQSGTGRRRAQGGDAARVLRGILARRPGVSARCG